MGRTVAFPVKGFLYSLFIVKICNAAYKPHWANEHAYRVVPLNLKNIRLMNRITNLNKRVGIVTTWNEPFDVASLRRVRSEARGC